MASESSSYYSYSQCDQCGKTIEGNNFYLNHISKPHFYESSNCFFPKPFQGFLSSVNGLTVQAPDNKIYKINQNGKFFITLETGKDPVISRCDNDDHICEKSQSAPRPQSSFIKLAYNAFRGPRFANRSESSSSIASASVNQNQEVAVGLCVFGPYSRFTGEESAIKVLCSGSLGGFGHEANLVLHDRREINVHINYKGIHLNGVLKESIMGTYKLFVLPGDNNFKLVKL
jgi:hypothetical protein